ncbi:MAG: lamin tail domain-containing protein, partial [Anaerolineae bacterium]
MKQPPAQGRVDDQSGPRPWGGALGRCRRPDRGILGQPLPAVRRAQIREGCVRPNHVISAPAILLAALGAVALAGGVDAGPQGAPGGQGAAVVINEVQYDPLPAGREARYEWIELLNVGPAPVEVSGWSVADNRATDPLPQFALEAGEYVVVAAGDGFRELFPDYAGDIVVLTGSIGNGLGNGGDQVRLLGPDGALVDGMSYGSDAGALDPPPGAVVAGHSLERVPAGVDSDTAGDWVDQAA